MVPVIYTYVPSNAALYPKISGLLAARLYRAIDCGILDRLVNALCMQRTLLCLATFRVLNARTFIMAV